MLKKLALSLTATVAVAVMAVLIFVATLDINNYKGVVAAELEELTGRNLEISGGLELRRSLRPSIIVRDARYANASWGTRPIMISAARVEAQIALLPLLVGRIKILRVGLFNVDALLETDAQGRGNWDVLPETDTTASARVAAEFKIDRVQIEQLKLTYRDGVSGEVFEATLPRLALSPKNDDELSITAQVIYRRTAIRIDGSIGRLRRLLEVRPYPLSLNIRLGTAGLELKGDIAKPLEGRGLDLEITAKVPSLTILSGIAGVPLPATETITLEAKLAGTPAVLALTDFVASLGETRFTGQIKLNTSGPRPRLVGKLSTPNLDIDRLWASRGQGPGNDNATATGRSDKFFSTVPLSFGVLKLGDADLEVQIERLTANGIEAKFARIELALDDGRLMIALAGMRIGASTVKAAIDLDARSALPVFKFRFTAPGLDVAALVGKTVASDFIEGKVDIDIDIKGRGVSVAALMGNLDGHGRLLMANGRAKLGKQIELLVGGVTTLFDTTATGNSQWTQLNCVAVDFEIEKGVASKKVMLVDTEFATVAGEGSIDLGNETIDMKMVPSPKSVTLNLAVPVKIGGTLMNPTFRPDELAAARRISGVAVMLFPPAALASLGALAVYGATAMVAAGDIGADVNHPCLRIAAGESQAVGNVAPAGTGKRQTKQNKNAGSLLQSINERRGPIRQPSEK